MRGGLLRAFSGIVGAAIGGYSQTGEDSSATGIFSGAAIGGALGSAMDYTRAVVPVAEYKSHAFKGVDAVISVSDVIRENAKMQEKIFSGNMDRVRQVEENAWSRVNRASAKVDKKARKFRPLFEYQNRKGGMKAHMAQLNDLQVKIKSAQGAIATIEKRIIHNVEQVTGKKFNSIAEINSWTRSTMGGNMSMKDLETIRSINSVFSMKGALDTQNPEAGFIQSFKVTSAPRATPAATDIGKIGAPGELGVESKLSEHLKSLGYDPVEADSLAERISKNPDLKGSTVSISGDQNLVIKGTSGETKVPLTKTDSNNIRMTTSTVAFRDADGMVHRAGTPMVVKNLNTGAYNFLAGTDVDLAGVSKKMDPLELLAESHRFRGHTASERIASAIQGMHSLQLYSSNDVLGAKTALARIQSSMVNIASFTIAEDGKFSKLSRWDTPGEMPTLDRVMEAMALQEANPVLFKSNNNLLDVYDLNAAEPSSPYVQSRVERGGSLATIRDQLPISGNLDNTLAPGSPLTAAHKSYAFHKMGMAEDLLHSNQMVRLDTSSRMSTLFGDNFGGKYVLDDGHILMDVRAKDSLVVGGVKAVELAEVNGTIKSMIPGLDTILSMPDGDERRLLIEGLSGLESGQGIGVGKSGAIEKVPGYFSTAKIVDISRTESGVKVFMATATDPLQDGAVKIFSQATKATATLVGSAADMGYSFSDYDAMKFLSVVENMGMLDITNDGKISFSEDLEIESLKGRTMTVDRLMKETDVSGRGNTSRQHDLISEIRTKYWSRATSIGGYDSGGQEIVGSILEGNTDEIVSFADKYKGKHILGEYAEELSSGTASKSRQVGLARAIMSVTEEKASRDIVDTTLDYLVNNDRLADAEEMRSLADDIRLGAASPTRDASARRYMDLIVSASESGHLNLGETVTSFVPDFNPSMHGSGSKGRLSHVGVGMLKSMGFDDEMMNVLGTKDASALHEIEMIRSASRTGQVEASSIYKGLDQLLDPSKEASTRAEWLARRGVPIDPGAKFASVGLEMRGMEDVLDEMRSMPISFQDTGRSGGYEHKNSHIMKQMDKLRGGVIRASGVYTDALDRDYGVERAKEAYVMARKQYLEGVKTAVSGSNNLVKDAAALMSDKSMIKTARPMGGALAKYAESVSIDGMAAVVGVSEGSAVERVRALGLDHMIDSSSGRIKQEYLTEMGSAGSGIYRIKEPTHGKWMELVTREPTQGPGSMIPTEVLLDRSLSSADDKFLFVPQARTEGGKNMYNLYQFLDYDADTLRMMPLNEMSQDQMAQVERVRSLMVKEAATMQSLQSSMGVKGSGVTKASALDYRDNIDHLVHEINANAKGTYRKPIAPHATGVVLAINEALDRHLGTGADLTDSAMVESWRTRTIGHNLTENMLKSMHKTTGDASLFTDSPVARLLQAQSDYIRTGQKGAAEYGQQLRSVFTETLAGDVSGDDLRVFNESLDTIVEAMTRHSLSIGEEGVLMTDFPKGNRKHADILNSIDEALVYGSRVEHSASGMTQSATSAPRMPKSSAISGSKNAIMEIAINNKKKLAAATAGLLAVAVVTGKRPDDTELLSSAHPSSGPKDARPLPPLKDRKAYIRKYRSDDGYSINANVRSSAANINPKSINDALLGGRVSTATINLRDHRGY